MPPTNPTAEVAAKLISLCREGKFEQAMNELYDPNIISVEGFDMNGKGRTVKGIEATRAKAKWWTDNHIIHSATLSDPFLSEEKFAVLFDFEVTFKPTNTKQHLKEVGIYTVTNGKITHEEFLYVM